ncbi:recombinase family protein [Microvirga splendida]|uniref:Recombinase family protein n=1 Tax=Microvirga splendida TaxID=2795727 RepID=A0ABS0XVG9_9HYPH|nr:recombinase family protein [Microvirga splendida]MBJ6124034.1 recombinase family protein [Microvirga splendida]
MLIGLARTSTDEQKAGLEAQVETLRALGVNEDHLFVEEASSVGKRPVLEEVLRFCRKGDTLIVTSLSRLARSVPHLWEIVQSLEKKGVALRILDLDIDTSTPNGRLMMTLVGGIVQWEREIMLERQRVGIAKARKEGKFRGRVPTARRQSTEVAKLKAEGIAPTDIAKRLKISRASVYRILSETGPCETEAR